MRDTIRKQWTEAPLYGATKSSKYRATKSSKWRATKSSKHRKSFVLSDAIHTKITASVNVIGAWIKYNAFPRASQMFMSTSSMLLKHDTFLPTSQNYACFLRTGCGCDLRVHCSHLWEIALVYSVSEACSKLTVHVMIEKWGGGVVDICKS